jgi:hypothetical protein
MAAAKKTEANKFGVHMKQNQMKTSVWNIGHRNLGLALLLGVTMCCGWGCKPKQVFLEATRLTLIEQEIPLRSLQFYNDKDIILRRKGTSSDVKTSGGKIYEQDGVTIQEIFIKKGTPCIVDGDENGKLLVRFENGEGKTLRFYKNSKNAFQIDSDRWIQKKGLIQYAGLDFIIEQESNDVLLVYKQTHRFKSIVENTVAKGVPLPK